VTTGTNLSSEGLDARRRRLLFRCWHRGIREMDLVLGHFADVQPVPENFDTALFHRLRDIHGKGTA
jgi:succinate dehydrogenase flavin-adding protein (antitoxin of CptAB toxin-antitoxin module)